MTAITTPRETASHSDILTLLDRPRCVIPIGEPGENESFWAGVPVLPAVTTAVLLEGGAPPRTDVRTLASAEALHVRFDCAVKNLAFLKQYTPSQELAQMERAVVQLAPHNDPTDRWIIEADYRMQVKVTRQRVISGEASLDHTYLPWQTSAPTGTASREIQRFHGVTRDGWFVELTIPWRTLGLPGRPSMLGFWYGRTYAIAGIDTPLLTAGWPPIKKEAPTMPLLRHAEALIGAASGAPERLEFPMPVFGRNRAKLVLGTQWQTRPTHLRVRMLTHAGQAFFGEDHEIASNASAVSFAYPLDRQQVNHLEPFNGQRLALELHDAQGQTLYRVSLPFDRHLGVCVDEIYGAEHPVEPIPGRAPTLRETWLARVQAKLPRLQRATTLQGAPSDFCLMHTDGRLFANLMANDPWKPFVECIEQNFQTTEDRLVAAMALIGQKAVTNLILCPNFFDVNGQPAYHSTLHQWIGPVSIIRYGGGPACCRAIVLAALLERLHDSNGGTTFQTRVVSLTKDGGPKQTTRRFVKGSAISPFTQAPGRVAAVAVQLGDQLTLLDPTLLAFFPVSAQKLAGLEQIVNDAIIRTQGVGVLESVYAKINIEETLRQPVNAQFAKGVYPELAPDEYGPDRPFDPADRLDVRVFAPRNGVEQVDGFRDVFGKPGQRDGSVRVTLDDARVTVRVQVRGVRPREWNAADREFEGVHIAFDVEHGHREYLHFATGPSAKKNIWLEEQGGIQTLFKRLSTENGSELADFSDRPWDVQWNESADGYEVVAQIPWSTLGDADLPKRLATIGLNVWIDGRAPRYERVFLSPPRHNMVEAFSFADLYLRAAPVVIEHLELGVVRWEENVGKVRVRNLSSAEITATVQADTELSMRRFIHHRPATTVKLPAGATQLVEFPFYVDGEERMTGNQQLVLRLKSGADEIYAGRWSVSYCGPISTYARFGSELGQQSRPTASAKPDQKYVIDRLRYIRSRIPLLKRVTTRDGAPSDFFLRAEDNSVTFNLMEPGILGKMTAWVGSLFEEETDKLLALFSLNEMPSVLRHMSGGHRVMDGATPLTVMRGNFAGAGGNCGYHSRGFAGMASSMKINGKKLIANTVGVAGHVMAFIEHNGRRSLLDPDVGHIILTADGQRIASVEELRQDPMGCIGTPGPGDRSRFVTMQESRLLMQADVTQSHLFGVFPLRSKGE